MEPVAERDGEQPRVPGDRLEHERGVRSVEDRIRTAHLRSQCLPRLDGRQPDIRHDRHRTQIRVGFESTNEAVRQGHGEPAEDGRRGVVRVPLDLRRCREHGRSVVFPAQVEQRRRGHHPRDRSGRRRSQSALERDAVHPMQREGRGFDPHPRGDRRDRPGHHVAPVRGELGGALALPRHHGFGARLDGHLVAQVEREPERVEPRAEVGAGRGHADGDPHIPRAPARRRPTPRPREPWSGSQPPRSPTPGPSGRGR